MSNQYRLVDLTIEGFRSFVQRQTIPFPQKGATLITGNWVGADTASGIGKSSIIMAIAYVLGYCDKPVTRLRSWYTKKFYVSLRLTNETVMITVTRDPKLKLHDGIKDYEGTAAEQRLTEILCTSPDLAALLTYRKQRKHGAFLNSTDADNKENLAKVLNLKEIESGYETANRSFADAQLRKVSLEGERDGIKISLDTCVITDDQVAEATKRLAEAKERVKSLSSGDTGKIKLQDRLGKLNTYLTKVNISKSNKTKWETENNQLKIQAATIHQQITQLREAKCFTCERGGWDKCAETLESKQADLTATVRKYEENLAAIKNLKPILDAEPKLQQQVAEVQGSIGALDAPLVDAARTLQSAQQALDVLTHAQKSRRLLAQRAELVNTQLSTLQGTIDVDRHVAAILGRAGFQSAIFDEVLREIQTRANDMIVCIPNISMYTLKINSTAVTKDGKVNKTINSKVFRDGFETQVDDSSGGQACGLELCTDVAYAESVRKRCSSPLGWMCLDEAMDGLDVGPKRAALEVLKSKVGGQILVIDHSTEVKEGFESVIEVEYDGRESRIVPA